MDMSKVTPAEAVKHLATKVVDMETLLNWYTMSLIADLADLGVPISLLAQAATAGFTPQRLLGLLYKWGPKVENGLMLELVLHHRGAAETCEPGVVVEADKGKVTQ